MEVKPLVFISVIYLYGVFLLCVKIVTTLISNTCSLLLKIAWILFISLDLKK